MLYKSCNLCNPDWVKKGSLPKLAVPFGYHRELGAIQICLIAC
jgi:hypothetical protein